MATRSAAKAATEQRRAGTSSLTESIVTRCCTLQRRSRYFPWLTTARVLIRLARECSARSAKSTRCTSTSLPAGIRRTITPACDYGAWCQIRNGRGCLRSGLAVCKNEFGRRNRLPHVRNLWMSVVAQAISPAFAPWCRLFQQRAQSRANSRQADMSSRERSGK